MILLIGAFRVHSGQLTIGELFVVLAYLDNLYWPLETIGGILTSILYVRRLQAADPELGLLPTRR